MPSKTKKDSVNIYLNGDEKDTMGINVHEHYIIQMNTTLQDDNKRLSNENICFENKLNDLQDELDRMEKSKTYMKGLIKNLVEIDKNREIITTNNKYIISQQTKHCNNILTNSRRYIMVAHIMCCFLSLFNFLFIDFNINHIILITTLTLYSYSNINFVNKHFIPPKFNKELNVIKELTKENKDTIKAIDYLYEYIESL